jgi:hypothetical protein
MEDFNSLAAALAADIDGVRASLILSRDGLVLGAHPETGESDAKAAWIRLGNLGDPERGFLQFGTETWCTVRRGPYAAFVLAGTNVRPGLVIDQMERVLLAAEEVRADRSSLRADAGSATPAATPAPASKPRTPLHPEPKPDDAPVVIRTEEPVAAATAATAASADAAAPSPTAGAPAAAPAGDRPDDGDPPSPTTSPEAAQPGGRGVWATAEGEEDDDTFSLSSEFGKLLQDEQGGADG